MLYVAPHICQEEVEASRKTPIGALPQWLVIFMWCIVTGCWHSCFSSRCCLCETTRMRRTNWKALLCCQVCRHMHSLCFTSCYMEWQRRFLPSMWGMFRQTSYPEWKVQEKQEVLNSWMADNFYHPATFSVSCMYTHVMHPHVMHCVCSSCSLSN